MSCSQTKRRSNALLLLLAAVASCAAPPASAPAPRTAQPRVVLDDEAIAVLAELLRAEDRRSLDSLRMAALLEHPLPVIRERAALAAGRIGDLRASGLLVRALDDSTRSVAAAAAFALGELRDTSSNVLYALAQKLGVTWDENDVRAVEAVAALGKLGSPGAHAALRQVLQRYIGSDAGLGNEPVQETPIGETGKEALLAIWRFPRAETDVDLVVPHLTSRDDEVRWRAMYVFTRISAPQSVSKIRNRLTDAHPVVRALAARALRAGPVDSARQRPETVAALRQALADPHPHVQINAARALGSYADSTLVPALDILLASEDSNVRIAATEALGLLGGASTIETLLGIARDTVKPLAERDAALRGVIRLAPRRGIAEVAEWAEAGDWLTRFYAASALEVGEWHQAARLIRPLAEDSDGRVAGAAIRAATALTDSMTAPYALYVQALGSEEVAVRAAAAAGLGRRRSAADLATLLEAYDRAQRDSANDAALAIVDALAALERADVPVSHAFFLRFRRSRDADVRRRVARHFGADAWGEPGENVAGRPAAFYERIVRDVVAPDLAYEDRPQATIRTAAGTIVIELAAARAPLTVHNFITLAANGYFPAHGEPGPPRLRWHRVVPNFMIQAGDPSGDGSGGGGYTIRDEINRLRYGRGVVGMALPLADTVSAAPGPRPGADPGGSQYFITHSPQPQLDGRYIAFGRVVAGMDVVDRVVQDDPIYSIEVVPVKRRETS